MPNVHTGAYAGVYIINVYVLSECPYNKLFPACAMTGSTFAGCLSESVSSSLGAQVDKNTAKAPGDCVATVQA